VFVDDNNSSNVWLIDADNLRFERIYGGNSVYTPHYGAPEIVQGRDQSRPRTDCWSFAVMAFRTLSLCHPFIGKKVLEPDDAEGGWDAEPAKDGVPADLDEQAYAGYLPFIDDEEDDTNANNSCFPRELVAHQHFDAFFRKLLARKDTTTPSSSNDVLGTGTSQGLRPFVNMSGLHNELFRRRL
jgi:serine/threonine protein kinase